MDNVQLPVTGTGTADIIAASDEVTYSGDTAQIPLVRAVSVIGAEGSKTVVDGVTASIVAPSSVTWDSSTASSTALTVDVRGFGAIAILFTRSGSVSSGVVTPEISVDGGSTWAQTILTEVRGASNPTFLFTIPLDSQNSPTHFSYGTGGITHLRLRLSTVIGGAGTITLTAAASASAPGFVVATVFQSSAAALKATVSPGAAPLNTQGGGTETSALRVTVANNSTGVLAVTDNSGSLTVDAPVATPVFVRLSDGAAAITTLPVADSAAETSLAVLDDWDESDRAKVNLIVGQAGVDGGSGVTTNLTQRVTLATDVALPAGDNNIGNVDIVTMPSVTIGTLPALVAGNANIGDVDVATVPSDPFGANADAASATGSISAKLRSIAAVQLPAALAANGGLKVEGVAGGVAVPISAASLPSHAVTNAGTFAVQVDGNALSSLQLIDDAVYADDAARSKTLAIGAVFDDSSPTAITENQAGYLRMSSRRALLVEGVAGGTAVPVSLASAPSTAVTNAGTFATQVDGSALTALQLIDDPIFADEAAFTTATSKVNVSGVKAVTSGSAPDDAGGTDRAVSPIANRNRVPFVIGGDPGVITLKHTTITTAVTDAAIITVAGSNKIVVTRVSVTLDNASTVFPTLLLGFGTTNTPTTTGVLVAHGGVPAGGGITVGDGSGILGIGADGEDLRVTTTGNATGNGLQIVVTYYLVVA